MRIRGRTRLSGGRGGWPLRVITAAALAVDAYVHFDLIARYDPNQGATGLSQGDLFRLEAVVSGFAALAVILTARRVVWMLAVLVAASALAASLLYSFFDPGAIGPLPDMYEPSWYPEKAVTAVAEAIATITALIGYFSRRRPAGGESYSEPSST